MFERGEYPGAKNMFGGVLYTGLFEQLFPKFRDQAPLERLITKRSLACLSGKAALTVGLSGQSFEQPSHTGFTVLRSKFDPWLARQAVGAGARLVTETLVDEPLLEAGRVVGVMVRREQGELPAH